ncbi:PrgI family protein [Rhodococcus sp. BH2-1]|nr:PrgI family protein [Rhodococcus sp. BH2-1]
MTVLTPDVRARETYTLGPAPRKTFAFGLNVYAALYVISSLVVAVLVQQTAGIKSALVLVVLLAVIGAPLVARFQRKTLYQWASLLVQWSLLKSRGENVFLSGRFSRVPEGTNKLPGVLYESKLREGWVQHHSQAKFGVIEIPKTHQFTVVIECYPQGNEAIDQDTVDLAVFNWGSAVNFIAMGGDVDGITVVIENGVETGHRLHREVRALAHKDFDGSTGGDGMYGGDLPARMMLESAEYLATGAPRLWARVAITYRATTAARRNDAGEQIKEMARRLGGVLTVLNEAQLNPRLLGMDEIVEYTKRAYSPGMIHDLEEAEINGGHGLNWDDAGPMAHVVSMGSYAHDGCISTTWEMAERPKSAFTETVLRPLLDPSPDLARKRVALCYRPHSPADSARIIEDDTRSARSGLNRIRRNGPTFEAEQRMETVLQQREDEGRGHGLTMLGVLVTVTMPEDGDIPKADAITRDLGVRSRIKLQRMWFTQDTAFAATLGVGVLLPSHTGRVSTKLGA